MNSFGNYAMPVNGFTPYGAAPVNPQVPAQPVFNQLLTADEVAQLQKNPNVFSTKLTQDEYLRAVCTHKDGANHFTLEKIPNGKHRCSVCQAEFFLLDLNTSKEEIENTCNNFYDLMQSIKTYYGNAPEAMREFYLMIGFIPKIAQLYQVARAYFDKVTGFGNAYQMGNDQNGFSILSNIFGGGAMAGVAPGLGGGMAGGYYGAPPAWGAQNVNPVWGQQQPGWYGGAPVPPAAGIQTPVSAGVPFGSQPAAAPGVNPALAMQQQPGYGYGMGGVAPAPIPSANPIGYVDPNAAPPATSQAGQVQASPTQAPAMPTPPPANPNVEKAEVNKTFAG